MGRKTVVHYPDARGKSPVLEWLLSLEPANQQKAFAYLGILYAFVGPYAVILHAFLKKTGSVPARDNQLAHSRLEDFRRRYEQGLMALKRQQT